MEEVSYKFLRGKSVGVIGCPFSGGQPKDGVDEGPLKIIEYGLIEQLQEMDWDVEFDGHLKLTDLKPKDDPNIGKLKRPRYVSRVTEAVSRSVERHHRKGQMVLTLGGDHSLALGTVSGTLAVHHDACLIWIDAHASTSLRKENTTIELLLFDNDNNNHQLFTILSTIKIIQRINNRNTHIKP
ncbi:24831_t:CDS:2 [Entrophospora sp. SA101]|nr:24831_t:CDS:2 [Entrophospora sp. SA101]CAJ0842481.1 109_t:CDS:2 [Entrophospora sp. SA101]